MGAHAGRRVVAPHQAGAAPRRRSGRGARPSYGGAAMTERLILVLDEGTNSTRAILYAPDGTTHGVAQRSEEHTSELQSLMRISYAVFCLKNTKREGHSHRRSRRACGRSKRINSSNKRKYTMPPPAKK